MASMSYCRFENTFNEINDCYEAMSELNFDSRNLSDTEKEYFRKFVELCGKIQEEFAEEAAHMMA